MTKEQELEQEFRRGYYLATANIMRTHHDSVIAEDVLHTYGNVDFSGIDPMEIKILKPLAAERKRKSRAASRRKAPLESNDGAEVSQEARKPL